MGPTVFELEIFGRVFAPGWYGLFIVGGAVVAAWLSARLSRRAGENPDHIWNLLAWTLLLGIIGARLYHVFSTPADGPGWAFYRENPFEIIRLWGGGKGGFGFTGLGIYGGLIGGLIAIVLYTRRNGLSFLSYLDYIGPNVLVAQAIGRLGNFANQELYGQATDLPWAFHINPVHPCQRPEGAPPCGVADVPQATLDWYAGNGFHPTFFYEAGWSLLLFGLLYFIYWQFGHRLRRGDGALMYFIAYPLGRFWVEYFRPDAWVMGELATAQWIAIISVAISIALLVVRHYGWSAQDNREESLFALSRHNPSPGVPLAAHAG
ncbi:MAG: prolipoprotein diacylglyceryl transferase [Caldilineaceae bacterium]|nr:prolipoprotein diacylglyceryl transferase [Caldilineaceae bacterium]